MLRSLVEVIDKSDAEYVDHGIIVKEAEEATSKSKTELFHEGDSVKLPISNLTEADRIAAAGLITVSLLWEGHGEVDQLWAKSCIESVRYRIDTKHSVHFYIIFISKVEYIVHTSARSSFQL